MVSEKLVRLIETHTEELCRRWLREVRLHEETFSYHTVPDEKLLGRARHLYSYIHQWIQNEKNRDEVDRVFTRLGAERYKEGSRLSEVVKKLMICRRVLWEFVEEQGLYDPAELYHVMELNDRVNHFFDRAVHFTIKGFETEAGLYRTIGATTR